MPEEKNSKSPNAGEQRQVEHDTGEARSEDIVVHSGSNKALDKKRKRRLEVNRIKARERRKKEKIKHQQEQQYTKRLSFETAKLKQENVMLRRRLQEYEMILQQTRTLCVLGQNVGRGYVDAPQHSVHLRPMRIPMQEKVTALPNPTNSMSQEISYSCSVPPTASWKLGAEAQVSPPFMLRRMQPVHSISPAQPAQLVHPAQASSS